MTARYNRESQKSMTQVLLNGTETDYSHPVFSSAYFMMYVYKVMPCSKTYRHDWRVCPYAHAGETAARRHPKLHSYVGVICPDTKKGEKCPRGESCPCTHSLFEYWLHPTRFKTEFCSRGSSCSRSFCFFAHSESEVRTFDTSVLSSPMARKALSIVEGNDPKRHANNRQRDDASSLIKQPFAPLDIGRKSQNIWALGPCDYHRASNVCGMATLNGDLATIASGLNIVPEASVSAHFSNIWDIDCSLSRFGSGQSTLLSSEIDSHQGNNVSWPAYSTQALDDYLRQEPLVTVLLDLLRPEDN